MNEEERKLAVEEMVRNGNYDPRIEYGYVPVLLVLLMITSKCFAYSSPYIAALFLTPEKVGLALSIQADATFDMLLATLVGYFVRGVVDKAGSKAVKPKI